MIAPFGTAHCDRVHRMADIKAVRCSRFILTKIMLPKRRAWKTQQKIGRVSSVLYLAITIEKCVKRTETFSSAFEIVVWGV